MKQLSEDDPLARGLADLPAIHLDAAAADAVRRLARAELCAPAEAARPLARLSLAWTSTLLPGLLLASGAAYTWGAVHMFVRVFGNAGG